MKSRKNIKSIIVMAIIGIVSLFFINRSLAAQTAIINVETANLRKEANENSTILELLSLNEKVEILEKDGDWYKIKTKGMTGYIRKDLIKLNEEENAENTNVGNTNEEQESQEQVPTIETSNNIEEQKDEIQLGKQRIAKNSKLKIIPSITAADIIDVQENEEIEVVEIINNWVCVKTQTGKGWTIKNKIKKEEQQVENQQVEENKENLEEDKKNEENTKQTDEKKDTVIRTLYINSTSVNLRKEPNTSSQIVGTLNLNTEVSVLEDIDKWSKVKVDGKEGYILSSLLSTSKKESSRSSETPRKAIQTEETDTTTSTNQNTTAVDSEKGTSVIETAKKYIGCKYVYGGASPSGFDCSGFTSYIYKQYGVNLNRTASGQYSNGKAINKGELQAGDLVMFGKSGINHVGIYIGGGIMVHAANPSRGVTTDTINSGYYYNNYVGARRVM